MGLAERQVVQRKCVTKTNVDVNDRGLIRFATEKAGRREGSLEAANVMKAASRALTITPRNVVAMACQSSSWDKYGEGVFPKPGEGEAC